MANTQVYARQVTISPALAGLPSNVAAALLQLVRPTVNRQTASYAAVLADVNNIVEMNVGSANNFTVPPHSSVAASAGDSFVVTQYGAGQTTIVAGAGVTLRSAGGKLKLNVQYSTCTIYQTNTPDEWVVAGDLST